MRKIFSAALVAAAVVFAGSAKSDLGPIAKWLMEQPVTLWDRGMDAMWDEATDLFDVDTNYWLVGGSDVKLYSVLVHYISKNNEIEISAEFRDVQYEFFVDHEWCNYVRQRVIERVLGMATASGMDEAAAQSWMKEAAYVIDRWFSHHTVYRDDRDKDLGAKLARIIFVQVELWPSEGSGIECRDRITSLDAPSKPLN